MATEVTTTPSQRVVTIAFRKVEQTGEIYYPLAKTGPPLLELEVLGEKHTLETVAELLFEYYLREIRDEELYEHIWRFEPPNTENLSHGDGYDVRLPLLSREMRIKNSFLSYHCPNVPDDSAAREPSPLEAGTELLFFYDEGSPTILAATIENITPMPQGKSADDYPLKKANPVDEERQAKKRRIEALPKLTISMDEAYPNLCKQLLRRSARLDIGNGSDCCSSKANPGRYAVFWGGGKCPAYQSSIECPFAFSNVDEMFLCFERGVIKQSEPNHPAMINRKTVKNLTTGEVRVEEEVMKEFEVHVRPYAASIDPATYESEYIKGMDVFEEYGQRKSQETKVLKREERWAFNFALPADELPRLLQEVNFSFVRQFPKCAKWLSNPSKQSHWFSLEQGRLKAMKHKSVMGKNDTPAYETAKYDNVHAIFADMEEQLVLPKSWK